jgi:hypothetical protein
MLIVYIFLDTDEAAKAKALNQMEWFNSPDHQQLHYTFLCQSQPDSPPLPYHLFNPDSYSDGSGCPFAPGCERVPAATKKKKPAPPVLTEKDLTCIHGHASCRLHRPHPFCNDCAECFVLVETSARPTTKRGMDMETGVDTRGWIHEFRYQPLRGVVYPPQKWAILNLYLEKRCKRV